MSEKVETKVKGFRIPSDMHDVVDNLVKHSGKEPGEWFADVISQISSGELVLEKNGVPAELRKHFSSDLTALKDALNSISILFVNQMNRITVEKNNWNELLQSKMVEQEEKQNKLKGQISVLEQTIQSQTIEIADANNTILQLHGKVEGFDKLEVQLRKDIERLEQDNSKGSLEIQRLRDESVAEKDKFYKDLEEQKTTHKEEKERLNQQIVDLVKQVNSAEPLIEENRKLIDKVKELNDSITRYNAEYEMKLTRLQEQAELEKEKALLSRERDLRDQLFKQNREDTKELYEKLEQLQAENNQLRIEISSLMSNK